MRQYGWLMVGAVALFGQSRAVVAAEPMSTPQPAMTPSGAPASFCTSCSASYTAHGTCAACPKHGWSRKAKCDDGGGKVGRFCSWLFYVPEKIGCGGICCNGSIRPQVPFYAYFPCKAGCGTAGASCSTAYGAVGHGAVTYRTVTHGSVAHGTVVQSAPAPAMTGGEAQSSGATASPVRLSTYKPAAISKKMPVLPPDQFKKPPAKNACDDCRR